MHKNNYRDQVYCYRLW